MRSHLTFDPQHFFPTMTITQHYRDYLNAFPCKKVLKFVFFKSKHCKEIYLTLTKDQKLEFRVVLIDTIDSVFFNQLHNNLCGRIGELLSNKLIPK